MGEPCEVDECEECVGCHNPAKIWSYEDGWIRKVCIECAVD